jgi:Uma2 family endonuclease
MASTTNWLVTFAELEQMPDSDRRYELRHGELVEVPPPEFAHYQIQRRLRRLLEAAVPGVSEVDIAFAFRALSEYEYRVADVAFVSREWWAHARNSRYFEGAPEIAIEVLSPSNSADEMLDKEQLCLENGAKEFWVVYPRRNQVRVSTAEGRATTYKSGQHIPLFFGGSVFVDEIFRD